MDIKKLEKATKIFGQIKILDSQIIEIDKFAMLVANGEIKSSFELKVEDIGKKREDSEKVSFDEDGSIVKKSDPLGLQGLYSIMMPVSWGCSTVETKKENEHSYKSELSETGTMQILGILLYEKQAQRQMLIKELQSFGVAV